MSLDEKFVPVRTAFYESVQNLFQKLAGLFGYPENSGLPTTPDFFDEMYTKYSFLSNLPVHTNSNLEPPKTFFEVLFGMIPRAEPVSKFMYENTEEGFYNFYIENYKNMFFLPDSVSAFLQLYFQICLDTTALEIFRQVLFIGLTIYGGLISLRILLAWFIIINPFTTPWCYLCAVIDWTDEAFQGLTPAIFGINFTANILYGVVGLMADSLNHLVFTMPYLPREGEPTKLLVNDEMKDVIVFHYLPYLWYKYSIPNQIREFWYTQRPEILDYMISSYPDLSSKFIPDNFTELIPIEWKEALDELEELEKLMKSFNYSDISHVPKVRETLSNFTFFDIDYLSPDLNFITRLAEQFHFFVIQ